MRLVAAGRPPTLPAPVRALRQRSTQLICPSIRRKPQCTTSWSSTTSTRSPRGGPCSPAGRLGPCRWPVPGTTRRDLPRPRLGLAVLEHAVVLRRLEGREAQSDAALSVAVQRRPSLRTASTNVPPSCASALSRTSRAVLVGVAHGLRRGSTGRAPRGSCGTPRGRRRRRADLEQAGTARAPLRALGERHRRRARQWPSGLISAARRSLERGCTSSASAAGRRRRAALVRQRERDAEQALHDALVDLAGEVDPLLQPAALLVYAVASRATDAIAIALPSVHSRWRSSRQLERPAPRSGRHAAARPAAAIGVQTRVVTPSDCA